MSTTRVSTVNAAWVPAAAFYGGDAFYQGAPMFEIKLLSDRRADGGGVSYLLKTTPPRGKLIKIVAVARSDEHVYVLKGGGCTKSGKQLGMPGDYRLNPKGQVHSAFIGMESVSLVTYAGEPDEICSIEVVDADLHEERAAA